MVRADHRAKPRRRSPPSPSANAATAGRPPAKPSARASLTGCKYCRNESSVVLYNRLALAALTEAACVVAWPPARLCVCVLVSARWRRHEHKQQRRCACMPHPPCRVPGASFNPSPTAPHTHVSATFWQRHPWPPPFAAAAVLPCADVAVCCHALPQGRHARHARHAPPRQRRVRGRGPLLRPELRALRTAALGWHALHSHGPRVHGPVRVAVYTGRSLRAGPRQQHHGGRARAGGRQRRGAQPPPAAPQNQRAAAAVRLPRRGPGGPGPGTAGAASAAPLRGAAPPARQGRAQRPAHR